MPIAYKTLKELRSPWLIAPTHSLSLGWGYCFYNHFMGKIFLLRLAVELLVLGTGSVQDSGD